MSGIDWPGMYSQAIERHHAFMDAVLARIAEGGDLKAVVATVIEWADGMDALTEWDPEPIKAAWRAAGGTDEDYPVVTLTIPLGDDSGSREQGR